MTTKKATIEIIDRPDNAVDVTVTIDDKSTIAGFKRSHDAHQAVGLVVRTLGLIGIETEVVQ